MTTGTRRCSRDVRSISCVHNDGLLGVCLCLIGWDAYKAIFLETPRGARTKLSGAFKSWTYSECTAALLISPNQEDQPAVRLYRSFVLPTSYTMSFGIRSLLRKSQYYLRNPCSPRPRPRPAFRYSCPPQPSCASNRAVNTTLDKNHRVVAAAYHHVLQ